MAKEYYNAMESVVENEYERTKQTLGCCTCAQCKSDMIAMALNMLTPRYVVTSRGELFSKLASTHSQNRSDILSALVKASETVRKSPRHRK